MLTKKHLQDVCLLNQGSAQCRYLEADPRDYTKFVCKKKTPSRNIYDELVEEHIKQCASEGVDPKQTSEAQGNNCSGYLPFKNILQGYDLD